MEDLNLVCTPFLKGKLKIYQPKQGYRFSIDSVLLANFIKVHPGERILELCAGCGIISLILAYKNPKIKVYTLEINSLLNKALFLSLKENDFLERILPLKGDLNHYPLLPGVFDVIFFNPPYFKKRHGRENKDPHENLARRASPKFIRNLFDTAKRLLKNKGRLYFIFTALRTAEILFLLKQSGLEPKILRFVHSKEGEEAKMLLICAIKGAGEETRVLPPLILYKSTKPKVYTEEVNCYFE